LFPGTSTAGHLAERKYIDAHVDPAPHTGEITGADEHVHIAASFYQPASGRSVTVKVTEE
jgi:hypothetical protein